jgi:hypothetical protein
MQKYLVFIEFPAFYCVLFNAFDNIAGIACRAVCVKHKRQTLENTRDQSLSLKRGMHAEI